MHIGIDLGTTFSCVAIINDEGIPEVICPMNEGLTTPSVIWFNGKAAYVGKKANDKKITPTSPIDEFVKRDIGKPKMINTRYEIDGFYYGAVGMSAIILRKLKRDAFNYLKKSGHFDESAIEKDTVIPCVITVPAYFGDLQRHETRSAGYAAGLDVIGIINEPTAAAIAYSTKLVEDKKIMVFDLGGGTFDVTILKVQNGDGIVIGSDGADQLGGRDWDELIIDFLYSEYRKLSGEEVPDDMGWDIQQWALQAKYDLTNTERTEVAIGDVVIALHRSSPPGDYFDEFDMTTDRPFYFEERSSNLLSLCRTICSRVVEKANLSWGDIDEVVLAGGSCRMPMIPAMLEELTGKRIIRNVPGFDYDTAIAIGAAIYGSHSSKVTDVTSKSIGIELRSNGQPFIEHLIKKNVPLPVLIEESFNAESNAVLKVYEGDSKRPEECIIRGRLELGNSTGTVKVTMNIDENGVLASVVEFPPKERRELQIRTDDGDIDLMSLREQIHAIDVRL